MSYSISKLDNGSITSPKGFLAGGVHAGLRYSKKDVGMIYSEVPAVAVSVPRTTAASTPFLPTAAFVSSPTTSTPRRSATSAFAMTASRSS